MTRINCVPPEELSRQHLVAEYRELPRVFTLAMAAFRRGEQPDDKRNPKEYTLGTGHCRFFYPRLRWLAERHALLVIEMARRGYKPTFIAQAPADINYRWLGHWEPTPEAVALNRARIKERS